MKNPNPYANVTRRTYHQYQPFHAQIPTVANQKVAFYGFAMTQRLESEGLTPQPEAAINWLPWEASAFEQSQEEGKPVLLSIGAVWCYWCQVMEEDTYTDPEVAEFISRYFIAVKVDNDHRPDINSRYNVGGWPSTVFLTGHGGYIAGATYLPPDQLLVMLMEVQRAYEERKPEVYDQANTLLHQRREEAAQATAGPDVTPELVDRIARLVAGTYDARNGGFGEEPKFPGIPMLRLLLHLLRSTGEDFYRAMLVKTLDAMAGSPLMDSLEGGFFRYSATADWSQPQHEKMLEDNLGLASVYMDAHVLLGNDRYREIAENTIQYLMASLYDPDAPGFRGSQGAHSDYFGLPDSQRLAQAPPPADSYCYSHWSAQAVSLLLEASWKLARPNLAAPALRVLDILAEKADGGSLPLAYRHGPTAATQDAQLLAGWANLLNTLADAANWHHAESERYVTRAREVASVLMERFYDADRGGFFDTADDPEAVGYLKAREKPLPENLAAVRGLLKLHHLTQDPSYHETARQTLSAYAETYRAHGEFAANYAVAVDLFLNPLVEITVEGAPSQPETQEMLRAACQLTYPNVVVKLAGGSPGGEAQAHVCVDNMCWPPVTDPAELAGLAAEAMTPREDPLGNIFQQFGGFQT